MKKMAKVTGIWLRHIAYNRAELLIEVGGSWRIVPILSGHLAKGLDSFPASEIIEMELKRFPIDPLEGRDD